MVLLVTLMWLVNIELGQAIRPILPASTRTLNPTIRWPNVWRVLCPVFANIRNGNTSCCRSRRTARRANFAEKNYGGPEQTFGVRPTNWIPADIAVGIASSLNPNRITGDVTAEPRTIVPVPVVEEPTFLIVVLSRKPQVDRRLLPVAVRILIGCGAPVAVACTLRPAPRSTRLRCCTG